MAALAVPGAASASLGTQCSGVNVTGQGASTQKLAHQTVWGPGFNTSKSKAACAGLKGQGSLGKPEVKYTSTGSGAGLESWGANKHAAVYDATNGFIGTDEGPDANQKKEIEENETTVTPNTLATIPVLQLAVSVIVHLPENCVATSKKNAGRLELNNLTLEGIYRGTITKWSQITEDGDKLSGEGCNPESTITPIARKDGSGTTHIFKRYLGLINGASFTTEKEESKTWNQIAEGPENTTWPKAANIVKPTGTGGGALVAKVAETASSIGYAGLPDARANGGFTPGAGKGGPGTSKFWAPLQNNGLGTTKQKFADPASNGDAEATADSNCKSTEYTNGEVAFPPSSVFEPWNAVTTRTIEKKYPLCGLTFDLAFSSFASFPGTSLGEATSVHDYLKFVVDTKGGGGQKLIAGHDYLALPKGAVLTEAQEGAAAIGF
ncbi:MAG TPA: substrate-binding domain-containing protein [Solirubrobacteraceae bacterium]|nr:substrate-binding domain-containing protein [Solirubrobacteraceae bacterium]